MAAFARPTRLVRAQAVQPSHAVDAGLFEIEEEHQLQHAYAQVVSQVLLITVSAMTKLATCVRHACRGSI